MFLKNRVCQHLRLIGISQRESSRMTSLIDKWHDASGPEWTNSRLKELEAYSKLRIQGGTPTVPIGWASIRTRRYSSRFKDDLLHKIFSCDKHDPVLALQFCRCRTGLIITSEDKSSKVRPTQMQIDKFNLAVMGPIPDYSNIYNIYSIYLENLKVILPKIKNTELSVLPMLFTGINPSKTSPIYMDDGSIDSAYRNDSRVYSLEILYSDADIAEWLDTNIIFASKCILGEGDTILPRPNAGSAIFSRPIGLISYIQEPGCKLRAVASPFLAIQALNEPLKIILKDVCRSIYQIVTFDQDRGVETLQEWIMSSNEVASYDASSYTDKFPLDFQLKCLAQLEDQDLISSEMVEIFSISSTKHYRDNTYHRNVKWSVGQPQGLGPSFHLGTFAHYVLVHNICTSINADTDCFRIVGDDIIINNKDVSDIYYKCMTDAGVDINLDKSMKSNLAGEFAGATVTVDRVIRRPKMRKLSSDSFVPMIDIMSSQGYASSIKRFIVDEAKNILVRKLSLPDDFGGRRLLLKTQLQLKPERLNGFKIMKRRILRDLLALASYDRKGVIDYYNSIYLKQTGIDHSLEAWNDTPYRKRTSIQYTEYANSYIKSGICISSNKFSNLLDRMQYDTLLSYIKDIRKIKNERTLKQYLLSRQSTFHHLGYVRETWDIPDDSSFKIALSIWREQIKTLSVGYDKDSHSEEPRMASSLFMVENPTEYISDKLTPIEIKETICQTEKTTTQEGKFPNRGSVRIAKRKRNRRKP